MEEVIAKVTSSYCKDQGLIGSALIEALNANLGLLSTKSKPIS